MIQNINLRTYKGLFVVFLMLFTAGLYAQAPGLMNYQAVIRNSNNELLVNKEVGVRITIRQGNGHGEVVFQEVHTVASNDNGLVSLEIGSGSAVIGQLSGVDWSNGPYWLQTETDPKGGADYSISGVNQILSVPYALYAEKAGQTDRPIDFVGTNGQTIRNNAGNWEATSTLFNNGTNVGIGTTTPVQKLDVAGSLNLSAGSGIRLGNMEMMHNRGGLGNLFLGPSAGSAVTTGVNNLAGGQSAGLSLTTGTQNMFLGNSAGRSLTNGLRNAFVGVNAGYSSNGNDNTYIGSNAGYFNTTGLNNTYIGRNAGYGVSGSTTGSNNTYLGTFAGNASTTGSGNLVAGYNAQTGASAGNTTVIGSTANGSASSTVAIGFGAVASGVGSIGGECRNDRCK